jgi:hypothetical protein
MTIFVGRTLDALRARGACCFPGCSGSAEHWHHVVYRPEEVIKPLCSLHHKEITMLNGQQSRKYGYYQLSNNFRWRIWYQWLEGKLKPRRTAKALEYVEEWDRVPTPLPDSIARPAEQAPNKKPDKPTRRKKKQSNVTRLGKKRGRK